MNISEKDLLVILEKIGSAVLVCLPDLRICSCNAEAASLLGCAQEEIIGRSFQDLQVQYLRPDRTILPLNELPAVTVMTEVQPQSSRIVGIKYDSLDSIVWTRMDARPEFEQDGSLGRIFVSLAAVSDTSDTLEKKRVDRQIKLAKDEWEKTVDAIHDLVIITDPEKRIIRANKAAHEIVGFRYGELTGKKCYEVFRGNASSCIGCPVASSEKNTTVCTGLVRNDILRKTFEVSSSPIYGDNEKVKYLVHTARDVTQALKDEAEKLRLSAAIEQTSEVIIITDSQGTIQYVNPAFTEKTGYTRAEVIGQNPRMLNSGEHDREFYQKIRETLLGNNVWKGQFVNRKKDGSLFWEDATISPVYNGEGQIANFVAVTRDISKEKSLERQLRHAMKMEAIGTLAGGIAHDFNNILSVMIGYGQIARGRLAENDPAIGDIDQILSAGDRAVDLVRQILTFSRHDLSEKFKLLRVQPMIKEFIKLLRPSLPVTIELEYSIQEDCPPILADSSQIYQVLMNLCTNAKQAINGGYGKIEVNLKVVHVDEENYRLTSLLKRPGDYVELEVRDNGCGMGADLQERIFEPFFTTKAKEQGTGLGLSVVHGIVKTHGGEIDVNSSVGRGTSFHIYFPVQEAPADDEPETYEFEQMGSGRIMVVDDEMAIAQMLKKMLERLGYSITIFTDSLEAVSSFRRKPDAFDLVLTDMTMPKMTGAELTREVLSLRPKLPVIMITGFSEIIDKDKAQRMGVKEFILKPVKKEKLSQVVKRVLGHG